MADFISISIFDALDGPLAISSVVGQVLHDRIAPLLRAGQRVVLSFGRMETVTPTKRTARFGEEGTFELVPQYRSLTP